jgi:hypothetical protein
VKTKQQDEYLDCMALKRRIQREIASETKGMTPLERLAHYRKLADESPFAAALRQRTRAPRKRA